MNVLFSGWNPGEGTGVFRAPLITKGYNQGNLNEPFYDESRFRVKTGHQGQKGFRMHNGAIYVAEKQGKRIRQFRNGENLAGRQSVEGGDGINFGTNFRPGSNWREWIGKVVLGSSLA